MVKFQTKPFGSPSILLYMVIPATLWFGSCHGPSRENQDGATLAKQYCATCHSFPEPSLADRNSWLTGILPGMGPRLGIFQYSGIKYPNERNLPGVPPYYYPSKPLLSATQWQAILNYYYTVAPENPLPQHRDEPIHPGLHLFQVEIPKTPPSHPPITTCLVLDPGNHLIYSCDGMDRRVSVYDRNLNLKTSLQAQSPVTWIDFGDSLTRKGPRKGILTDIGILPPSELKAGSIQELEVDENGNASISGKTIADSLHRPVEVLQADLNGDGRTDLVVCDFGNLTGELFWLENQGNGVYIRHLLRDQPGAIKACIRRDSHSGLPDIWVLFAQGDESLFKFENEGHGQFLEKRVLQFPPINGSSSFELDDFNGDGYPDILYTCGDNSDYSKILKNYHGVYIFLNDGKDHFTERFFYPINGCYKAMARDFRNNGKLDIATIAFFADYQHQPEESFVYFENEGGMKFRPFTMPISGLGRWITMDAGDLYGNGKQDIILGNFSVGPSNMPSLPEWNTDPPFIVLKNISGPSHP
ncbi:MAG TPA: VCBS repeat-containing protein [Chitinophagaceae bacterium]|nr:VCBS repeat-containing protein [Chitinophagaceae bacterium]